MVPKTNGQGLNLILDKELAFSESQVLASTVDTASTNAIALGDTDYSKGAPIKINVFIEALTGTLTIKVCGKAGSTPADTDILQTISVAYGKTGIVSTTISQVDELDNFKLYYSAGISGTVSAYMTAEV